MYSVTGHDKVRILTESLKQREQEVFMYQVNVDNYRLAIEMAPWKMWKVKRGLIKTLKTELKQQSIAQLMLDVVLKQLENEDINELLKPKKEKEKEDELLRRVK